MWQESPLAAFGEWVWCEPLTFLPAVGKEKGLGDKNPDAGPEWLKQFDAVLPGYTLKSQLDILSLLKQVGLEGRVLGRSCCLGQKRLRALGRMQPGCEGREEAGQGRNRADTHCPGHPLLGEPCPRPAYPAQLHLQRLQSGRATALSPAP